MKHWELLDESVGAIQAVLGTAKNCVVDEAFSQGQKTPQNDVNANLSGVAKSVVSNA